MPMPALQRLERNSASLVDGCWEWTGAKDRDGYGFLTFGQGPAKKYHRAHRLAYQLLIGEVPSGKVLDHLCGNRACINPDHLEPVTQRENLERAGRTQNSRPRCARGHLFDAENTLTRADGGRHCRACQRIRNGRARPEDLAVSRGDRQAA